MTDKIFLLKQIWTSRIKRDPKEDFKITSSTKVCSDHFEDEGFTFVNSRSRRLKTGACPSVFSWTRPKNQRTLPAKMAQLEEERKILEAEETETASEGEGFFEKVDEQRINRGNQVNLEVECSHRMSVNVLKSKCTTPKKETKLFSDFTVFRNYTQFREFLQFVLPGQQRFYELEGSSSGI